MMEWVNLDLFNQSMQQSLGETEGTHVLNLE